MNERRTGIITRAQSGFFTVQSEEDSVVCTIRGQLQEIRRDTDLAALGDQVPFLTQANRLPRVI